MPLLGQDLPRALSTRIAILGPGLIGGSLALALRRAEPSPEIVLWARREETVQTLSHDWPWCHPTASLEVAVTDARAVVLCTPPASIVELGKAIAPFLRPGTLVTDAGSVKLGIVSALEAALGPCFVGAHPMAGSEKSGLLAARADLFDGACCILTPTCGTSSDALEAARLLWGSAGCLLHEMSPEAHDRAIGRVSHLPHAAAAALVRAALAQDPSAAAFAGSGYRDSTRIAEGPEDLWTEIFMENRVPLLGGIDDLLKSLETLKTALQIGDREAVAEFLAGARALRSSRSPKS